MAERHIPSIEVLACQPESLRAVIDAVRRERQLRPLLTRLVQHAYEATKRRAARIAVINRIGQLITSSLSLDQILQTAVEAIDEHLHYPIVAVLLVDADDPTTLVLRACTNVCLLREIGRYRQSVQHGIIGAAARARKPLLLTDVASDPRYLTPPGAGNICAEVAVPIVVGDRLLGVLNVESERRITEDEADGLQIVADQLGVAIDNAHLFARTQQTLRKPSSCTRPAGV